MNNRPPPRRGLGRGLGSLIPSGPVATETLEETERSEAAPSGSAAAPATADWIGRIPAPGLRPAAPPTPRATGSPSVGSPAVGVERRGPVTVSSPVEGEPGLRPVAGAYFAELPVDSISPNPKQPRQVFDEDAMAELVVSIREVGLLQPVVVRSTGDDRYELIMGERRLRATQEAGLDRIPASVRDTADDALLRDALLENLHRSQLNPLEEAAAYQQLLDDFGCTHDELATRIGRSRPQISNTLRLLRLSPAVQRRVAAGVLSAGHARTLLAVVDPGQQDKLAARVVAEGISVRGLEELVAVGDLGGSEPTTRRRPRTSPPELGHLTDRLSDRFDTRVKVDVGRSKGRITIEFASVEDLQRIVSLMDPAYVSEKGSGGSDQGEPRPPR